MRWGILCAGVGGFEWGLKVAGHTVVWAVEYDPDAKHGQVAADYHRLNHPDTMLINQDIRDVDVGELPNVDAIQISPPCQSHSTARRKNLPARDDAWVGRDILRYTAELSPRVVMIENVPAYRKHPVYREIVAGLVDQGYTVEARVLNCADYGVPQTRERLIIQARADGRISWPRPVAQHVGWYAAIHDILPPPDRPLAPWQAKRWRAAYDSLKPVLVDGQFAYARNAETQVNLLTVRQSAEPGMTITAHTDRMDIVYPVLLDGQLTYGEDALSVLTAERPASCVMASDHSRKDIVWPVLVGNQVFDGKLHSELPIEPASTVLSAWASRKDVVYPATQPMRARLTAHCAARLQTLPDSAIWPDTFSQAMKLIGNAVPSLLAQRLAEAAVAPDVWRVSLWEGSAA